MFIEEMDAEDFNMVCADGSRPMALDEDFDVGKKRKRKGKGKGGKQAGKATGAVSAVEAAGSAVAQPEVPADLPAWERFELHPKLLAAMAKQGFSSPTLVQARCFDAAIRMRKDLVGAAETGSGKTLAFGLPILHHILTALDAEGTDEAQPRGSPEPKALIILPTRELAVQVAAHVNNAAQLTPVRAECMVGGMALPKQHRLLKRRPHIVVGTPGRLNVLLGFGKDRRTEMCEWLKDGCSGLRHLVLDEADRLTESGHFRELDVILQHVYGSLQRAQQLQTFVFSATLGLDPRTKRHKGRDGEDGGKIADLMQRMKFRELRAVHVVDLTKAGDAPQAQGGDGQEADEAAYPKKIAQLPEQLQFFNAVCTDDKDREALLTLWLLRRYRWNEAGDAAKGEASEGGRVVIFTNAITMVTRLRSIVALLLEAPSADSVLARVMMTRSKAADPKAPKQTVEVVGLQSHMKQKDRMKRMEKFRSSKNAVLICTDIAARGLDVKDVAAVLHYQAPRTAEVFIHRSGRTARAGRSGDCVAFCSPKDATHWQRLYRGLGIDKDQIGNIEPTSFEVQAAKEVSRLAVDLESKIHQEGKRLSDQSWVKKMAEDADLVLSDDDEDNDAGKAKQPKQALWGLYRQFLNRVRRPPKRMGAAPLPREGAQRMGRRRRR